MYRALRCGLLAWFFLCLTACVAEQDAPQFQTKRYVFPDRIDRIVVTGPVHLDIVRQNMHGRDRDNLMLSGALAKIKTVFTDHTLYIQSFSPIQANIHIGHQDLLALQYDGEAEISCLNVRINNVKVNAESANLIDLSNIEADNVRLVLNHVRHVCLNKAHIETLSLVANDIQSIEASQARLGNTQLIVDSGTTELNGYIKLSTLTVSGNSVVNVVWVNADKITIKAKDHAQVFLGGVANWSDLTGTESAQIDARYLRTETVFARGENHSQIGVLALRILNAYAVDQSRIFYYQNPNIIISKYWRNNGTVLFGGVLPPMPVPPICAPVPYISG